MREYLQPGEYVDSDHPAVREFTARATAGAHDEHDQISRLFLAVRDGIRYDPYRLTFDPATYRASHATTLDGTFCVPKAVLLAAGARVLGIPARLAFADVRNHLSSPRILELLGTDVFAFHGYTELYVDGEWRKASPAFNASLCERFGVEALNFDGTADALLHPFSGDGSRYMEYVRHRGTFADLPLEEMFDTFRSEYPDMVSFAARQDAKAEDPVFAPPAAP